MRGSITILLLLIANIFMTLAWYGHLKLTQLPRFSKMGIVSIILISWGLAFFEYIFQVPANKFGFKEYGGPFSLLQLKIIQEVITLSVFMIFSFCFFKNESFKMNHFVGILFLLLAVYFIFKK